MSRFESTLLAAIMALVAPTLATARQSGVNWPTTHPLPQTATIGTRFVDTKFHVRPGDRADTNGQSPHGIPVWQIVVFDGTGSWDNGSPAPLPKFVMDSALALRGRIALFKAADGWVVVPRGWHVQSAAEGAVPDWGVTFVAPGGPRRGWMATGGSYDISGILSGAEGLFPSAHRRYDALEHVQTPGVRLTPRPDSLTYPNPCTAALSYRSGDLVVKAVELWQPLDTPQHPSYSTGISIALPQDEAALQGYLIAAFRRLPPTGDGFCPKAGW